MMEFHAALKKAMERMGLRELKPKQTEAIQSFVSGRDTFVSLPTGYGKSVIFAILPILFDFLRGEYEIFNTSMMCFNFIMQGLKEALLWLSPH